MLHTSLIVLVDQKEKGIYIYLTRTKRSAGNFLH